MEQKFILQGIQSFKINLWYKKQLMINNIKRLPFAKLLTSALSRQSFAILHKPQYSIGYAKILFTNQYYARVSKKQKQKAVEKQTKNKARDQLTKVIDLQIYETKFKQVIQKYKATLSTFKIGRMDSNFFTNVHCKIGNRNQKISDLAQIAPKNASTCILIPFNSDNLEDVHKAMINSDLGFEISKVDKTIVVKYPEDSKKDLKQKIKLKAKKLTQERKQRLRQQISSSKNDIKKYKKLIPESQLRNIENQLKSLSEKYLSEIDKLYKDKQKQIMK